MTTPPVPLKRWILAGGLAALGVLPALAILLTSIFTLFASLLRVDSPGSGEIHLEPGNYAVYYESVALAKKNYKVPGITVGIQAKDGGASVVVNNDILFPVRYSTLSHHGELSSEFTIDHAGDYRVTVSAPLLKQPAPGNISIARALGVSGFVRLAVIPFTLFWGGIGAGLFVLLRKPKSA